MASRFWVGGSGTWDASDTSHWASTSGGTPGASVPGPSDTVTLDANSNGTIDIGTGSISIGAFTLAAFVGTLNFNNYDVTMASFTRTQSAVNTVNLGTGTLTLNGANGTLLGINYVTGCTFNGASARILIEGASSGATRAVLFNPNGGTYSIGTLEFKETGSARWPVTFSYWSATVTVVDLIFETGISICAIQGFRCTNLTMGGSAGSPIALMAFSGACALNVVNNFAADYVHVSGVTKTGTGTITFNNSYDGGGNGAGVTINPPSGGGGGLLVNPGMRGGMI